jgi:hypothetical protein
MRASQINRGLDFLRDAFNEASKLWWRFFDWLAVVEWRQLLLTWFLAWVFCIIVNMPEPAFWYMIHFLRRQGAGRRQAQGRAGGARRHRAGQTSPRSSGA